MTFTPEQRREIWDRWDQQAAQERRYREAYPDEPPLWEDDAQGNPPGYKGKVFAGEFYS